MDIENIGVGVIIKNTNTNKYLLVKERRTDEKTNKFEGDLSIVVGHIKKGESLIDTALREIREELETDFTLKMDDFIGIAHYLKGEVVILFVSCTEKEDLGRGAWFSFEEIKNLENLRPSNFEILEKYHNAGFINLEKIRTFTV